MQKTPAAFIKIHEAFGPRGFTRNDRQGGFNTNSR
jgi:hypothetical protein